MQRNLTVPELKKLVQANEGVALRIDGGTAYTWPDGGCWLYVYLISEAGNNIDSGRIDPESLFNWLEARQDW